MALTPQSVTRRYFLIFGGVFFLAGGLNLIRAWHQRPDIWWTPPALATPAADGRDRVQIYVRGEPLESAVNRGALQLVGEGGRFPLAASDITLRLNNYDRVRAGRLPAVLSAAMGVGAAGVLLLLGIVGMTPKPERPSRRAEAGA